DILSPVLYRSAPGSCRLPAPAAGGCRVPKPTVFASKCNGDAVKESGEQNSACAKW
ncbi:Hypothetical protein SMAX5B_001104, partial [Scophthalmus maximus]